jgi:hypothetical protein
VQVLDSSPWDWMLFRNDGNLFFTVLCGSVAMYSVDIHLSESEVTDYAKRNREALASLATKIRMNPEGYSDRHIKGSHDN